MEVTQDNRFDIAPETKLWRYMSFAKFVALLHDRELVLSPLHQFEDPYEGAGGIARNLEKFTKALVDYFWDKVSVEIESLHVTKEQMPEYLNAYIQSASDLGRSNRYYSFVNCWHENKCKRIESRD